MSINNVSIYLMNVIIDTNYRWQSCIYDDLKYWYIGSEKAVKKFISYCSYCQNNPHASINELNRLFHNLAGNFAFIIEQGSRLIAAVDRIRSYPIFYVYNGANFAVSNSARALRDKYGLFEIDELSLLEFCMAGYVTGRETLFRHLYQLQAGEFFVWDETDARLERERYYLFFPEEFRQDQEDDLIEELDDITNKVFIEIIEQTKGAPIWVPLSGGLDSRLVLCKLKQLGYSDLKAFSYGPPGNYEAKAAKYVAETLDVPWFFVPSKRAQSRKFFHSEIRRNYWEFSDGLSTIPFMQDLDTLLILRKRRKLSEDAVVINGQSGDFISGGHIPLILVQENLPLQRFLDAITEKHFSLWLHLKTDENMNHIENKILHLLKFRGNGSPLKSPPSYYEYWEWQERQCKYVVNGQRIYDFMHLSWELPLWHLRYLKFWERIPPNRKFGQGLYRRYLSKYNYRRLFKDFSPNIWRWPGASIGIVPVAKITGLLFGKKRKEMVYKYASYFGHYGNHFAGYGLKYFFKNILNARSVISFSVAAWLQENGISLDTFDADKDFRCLPLPGSKIKNRQ